jgi:hypothetical protein
MTPTEILPDIAAATQAPKRLYRLIEPAYADLPAAPLAEFFHRALEPTVERFGEKAGIEAVVLARREGARWKVVAGTDAPSSSGCSA